MSVKWKGPHMGNLKFTLDQIPKKVTTSANRALQDAAEAGVESMQNTISTAPSSLVPGKVGRIDTGHMIESVGSKFNGRLSTVIGWTRDKDDYFIAQDQGTGSKSGDGFANISPMHALLGARIVAVDEFHKTMRVLMKNA